MIALVFAACRGSFTNELVHEKCASMNSTVRLAPMDGWAHRWGVWAPTNYDRYPPGTPNLEFTQVGRTAFCARTADRPLEVACYDYASNLILAEACELRGDEVVRELISQLGPEVRQPTLEELVHGRPEPGPGGGRESGADLQPTEGGR